jgi:thiamine-phosphate pyrophosphorylase
VRTNNPQFAVARIIDANTNRAKEGLRVCEEVARFVLNNRSLTRALKNARHKLDLISAGLADKALMLRARESRSDVGRTLSAQEFSRKDLGDIFAANMQRAKESVRVLEEFTKLGDARKALSCKALRYELYEIEKAIAGQRASLLYRR